MHSGVVGLLLLDLDWTQHRDEVEMDLATFPFVRNQIPTSTPHWSEPQHIILTGPGNFKDVARLWLPMRSRMSDESRLVASTAIILPCEQFRAYQLDDSESHELARFRGRAFASQHGVLEVNCSFSPDNVLSTSKARSVQSTE